VTKTIVKYANRKLYDKELSRYTSLSEIMKLPMGSFRVLQHMPDNRIVDITTETLLAALSSVETVEAAKKVEILKFCVERLA